MSRPRWHGRMVDVPRIWQESPVRRSGGPRCGTGRGGIPPTLRPVVGPPPGAAVRPPGTAAPTASREARQAPHSPGTVVNRPGVRGLSARPEVSGRLLPDLRGPGPRRGGVRLLEPRRPTDHQHREHRRGHRQQVRAEQDGQRPAVAVVVPGGGVGPRAGGARPTRHTSSVIRRGSTKSANGTDQPPIARPRPSCAPCGWITSAFTRTRRNRTRKTTRVPVTSSRPSPSARPPRPGRAAQ